MFFNGNIKIEQNRTEKLRKQNFNSKYKNFKFFKIFYLFFFYHKSDILSWGD